MSRFNHSVSGVRATATGIDTSAIFDSCYQEPDDSPIDIFFESVAMSSRLLGVPPSPVSNEWKYTANLVVLGVVSSVETYFRSVIRAVIQFDSIAQKKSLAKQLSYGAAIYHEEHLLPEALMEGVVFSGRKNIEDNVKEFLGIPVKQHSALTSALDNFDIVCQLRHCIVHRSGRLGSKNAISLGLDSHSPFLEKPIVIGFDSVQEIFQICRALVQEVNDFIFCQLLDRSSDNFDWQNDLRKDKAAMKKYFNLFARRTLNNNYEIRECHKKLMSKLGI